MIFVVDSNDRDRISEARDELHRMLNEDELRDAAVLVYANKQDLPGALSDLEITSALELGDIKNREWAIVKTSALKGEGLWEGMEWLVNVLKARP